MTFESLTFPLGDHDINGNRFTLLNGIVVNGGRFIHVDCDVTLGGSQKFEATQRSAYLTLGGIVDMNGYALTVAAHPDSGLFHFTDQFAGEGQLFIESGRTSWLSLTGGFTGAENGGHTGPVVATGGSIKSTASDVSQVDGLQLGPGVTFDQLAKGASHGFPATSTPLTVFGPVDLGSATLYLHGDGYQPLTPIRSSLSSITTAPIRSAARSRICRKARSSRWSTTRAANARHRPRAFASRTRAATATTSR